MNTAVLPAIASARALVSGELAAVGALAEAKAGKASKASTAAAQASARTLTVAAAKVLRRNLVEEVFEAVNDLFGVLYLVLELDRRLGDHVLGCVDR